MKTDINFIRIHDGRGFRTSRTVLLTPKFYQILKAAKQSGKVIPEWVSDGEYPIGSYIQYEGNIFLTKKDIAKSDDFDPDDHKKIRVGSVALNQKEASHYNRNDIVEKDGKLVVSTDKVDEEHPESDWVEIQTGMLIDSIVTYANGTFSGTPRKSEKLIFVDLDDTELPTPYTPKNDEGEEIPTNPVEFYKTDTIAIRGRSQDMVEGMMAVTLSGIDKNIFDTNFDPEERILVTFFTNEEDKGVTAELRTDGGGPTIISNDGGGNKQIAIPFSFLIQEAGYESNFYQSAIPVIIAGEQRDVLLPLNKDSFITITYSLFSELPLTDDGSITPEWIDYDQGKRLSLIPDNGKKIPGDSLSELMTVDYQKKLIYQPDVEYVCYRKDYFNSPTIDVPIDLIAILRDKVGLVGQASEFKGMIKIYVSKPGPMDATDYTYAGQINTTVKNFKSAMENSPAPPSDVAMFIPVTMMADQDVEITLTNTEGTEISGIDFVEEDVFKLSNPFFDESEDPGMGSFVCTFNGYFLGVPGYEGDKLTPFGHLGTVANPKIDTYTYDYNLKGNDVVKAPVESKIYIGTVALMPPMPSPDSEMAT